jgi:hypothetical protein
VPEHKKIEGEKRVRNEGWRLKEIQKVKEVIMIIFMNIFKVLKMYLFICLFDLIYLLQ